MNISNKVFSSIRKTLLRAKDKVAHSSKIICDFLKKRKKLYRRHEHTIQFILIALIALLVVANVQKEQKISIRWLAERKDALAALNSIVTIVLLLIGSTFSYYRFFYGQTLAIRLELLLDVSVHGPPEESPFQLHVICLTVKNIGSFSLWNPMVKLTVVPHVGGMSSDVGRTSSPKDEITMSPWFQNGSNSVSADPTISDPMILIASGETAPFFAQREIPKEVWAVTYIVRLEAGNGTVWSTSKTVSNKTTNESDKQKR
ncbi:hypothetical protein [Leptolyngbya sp. 7M]|uniref:hypothetical protein n=1 Tax=Leptolyngbya sp. 7M TaxID=2812896 RepID=UPI001B8C1F34|nr:hypothetical protein [Leptolyngbya sp. 7M]QYO61956.1 hypothetical protein JVX88_17660 [Leptolyngbya sp. 7M]